MNESTEDVDETEEDAMDSKMYANTGLEVVFNGRTSKVFLADSAAQKWDGALRETNAAIWSDRLGCFFYVELRITGHSEKRHAGGIYGTKARIRFTDAPDNAQAEQVGTDGTVSNVGPGNWSDAVVRSQR